MWNRHKKNLRYKVTNSEKKEATLILSNKHKKIPY